MIARLDRLVFYRGYDRLRFDSRGKVLGHVPDWRWRYVAANGNVLAVSSEGYRKRIDAVKCAARVTGHGIDYLRPAVDEAARTAVVVETVSVRVEVVK
ncbi:DUF1508 domain-containing protein [Mumia sp. DW29H23]|uniref:DUF1508 domain-containing protein n=1 Tax=Mumia sp. DW29H23 TaxID=3421241 RepID=UPI003D696AEC